MKTLSELFDAICPTSGIDVDENGNLSQRNWDEPILVIYKSDFIKVVEERIRFETLSNQTNPPNH
jgi:hypothetical protein